MKFADERPYSLVVDERFYNVAILQMKFADERPRLCQMDLVIHTWRGACGDSEDRSVSRVLSQWGVCGASAFNFWMVFVCDSMSGGFGGLPVRFHGLMGCNDWEIRMASWCLAVRGLK